MSRRNSYSPSINENGLGRSSRIGRSTRVKARFSLDWFFAQQSLHPGGKGRRQEPAVQLLPVTTASPRVGWAARAGAFASRVLTGRLFRQRKAV